MRQHRLLVTLVVYVIGCHRKPVILLDYCSPSLPPVGPAGSATLTEAVVPDSGLLSRGQAGLVVSFAWSSDSLAALSKPDWRIVLEPGNNREHVLVGSATNEPGAVTTYVTLDGVPGGYAANAMAIGGVSVHGHVALRRGYRDTLFVRLQQHGVSVCY